MTFLIIQFDYTHVEHNPTHLGGICAPIAIYWENQVDHFKQLCAAC